MKMVFAMKDVSLYTEEQHLKRIDAVNGAVGQVNNLFRLRMIDIATFVGM